jgi:hypothetical protein
MRVRPPEGTVFSAIGALALCFLFSPTAVSNNDFAEQTRITSTSETVEGHSYPANSSLTFDSQGRLAEVVLGSATSLDAASFPQGATLVILGGGVRIAVVPDSGMAQALGQSFSGRIVDLPQQQPPALSNVDECEDAGSSWTAVGGPRDTLENVVPEPLSVVPKDLISQHSGPHLLVLVGDLRLPLLTMSRGSMLQSTDGTTIDGFYFRTAGRFGGRTMPPHTFVRYRGPEPSIVSRYNVELRADLWATAGTPTILYSNGTVDSVQLAKPISDSGIQIPAGSRVLWDLSGNLDRIRLAGDTSVFGFAVPKDRMVCFLEGKKANIPITSQTSIGQYSFPAGSYVIVSYGGSLIRATLHEEVTLAGLDISPLPGRPRVAVDFNDNGTVKSVVINKPTVIGGIHIAPGLVQIKDNGQLLIGTLDSDQTIAGVPCLAHSDVVLNQDGDVLAFTASADYTIGTTTLHRGQRFIGIYDTQATITVRSGDDFQKDLEQVLQQIGDGFSKEIASHRNSDVFASMDSIHPQNYSKAISRDHIDFHVEASVENFLKNVPPFAACDCTNSADVTIAWQVGVSRIPYCNFYPSRTVWSVSCTSTCLSAPFIAFTAAIAQFARNLFGSPMPAPGFVPPSINEVGHDLGQLAKNLSADPDVLPWSIRLEEIFIEGNELRATFSYKRRLK